MGRRPTIVRNGVMQRAPHHLMGTSKNFEWMSPMGVLDPDQARPVKEAGPKSPTAEQLFHSNVAGEEWMKKQHSPEGSTRSGDAAGARSCETPPWHSTFLHQPGSDLPARARWAPTAPVTHGGRGPGPSPAVRSVLFSVRAGVLRVFRVRSQHVRYTDAEGR
jgi:hypothetical protein